MVVILNDVIRRLASVEINLILRYMRPIVLYACSRYFWVNYV